MVYAKRPFAGPEAVLAYLSRYTHRVAISNSRLVSLDDNGVTFRWKDYRARGKAPGQAFIKSMTLAVGEFIRRFLLHVLPDGFHRIRHYGMFASAVRAANIANLRALISEPEVQREASKAEGEDEPSADAPRCRCCGGRMTTFEFFARGETPHLVSRNHLDRHLMIATAPFAPGRCRSCRADPITPGACASVMLRAPGGMARPRHIDHRQRQNQRFAGCGTNNYRRARRLHCRPTPTPPTNPHSIPQNRSSPERYPAVSFPGGFPTPAPCRRRGFRLGRHPKPFT